MFVVRSQFERGCFFCPVRSAFRGTMEQRVKRRSTAELAVSKTNQWATMPKPTSGAFSALH